MMEDDEHESWKQSARRQVDVAFSTMLIAGFVIGALAMLAWILIFSPWCWYA